MYEYKLKEGNVIEVELNKAHKFCQLHTHQFVEIVYIISGIGEELIDDMTYEVSAGSLLFINYNQAHAFRSQRGLTYYNVMIKPEAVSEQIVNAENAFEILTLTAFEEFRQMDTTNEFMTFVGEQRVKVESIMEEIYNEYIKKPRGYAAVLRGYMTVLLSYIFRRMTEGAADDYRGIPPMILDYISTHLKEKLSLETLAAKSFYSPNYFSQVFKDSCGMTVTEYVKRKRLEEGCRLLRDTTLPIDSISRMVGYDDNVRFYKYFHQMFGMTPREYRLREQANADKTKEQ